MYFKVRIPVTKGIIHKQSMTMIKSNIARKYFKHFDLERRGKMKRSANTTVYIIPITRLISRANPWNLLLVNSSSWVEKESMSAFKTKCDVYQVMMALAKQEPHQKVAIM